MPGTVEVEFRVLGPVEVSASGHVLSPAEPRQQAVLAALVVDAGRTVSTETLIDRVWGDRPPAQARRTLHAHLSRVRGVLDGAGQQLERGPGGYRLAVAAEQLDLHRFRALAARGQDDAVPPRERAALLREALALWRGEPLAGLRSSWADGRRQAWSQERTAATLAWAAAETDAGNAEAAVGPLAQLTDEQPLAEPAAAMLMRVLAAAGRPAQALDEFTRIRRDLRDELGVEPGPDLQAAQRDVLRGAVPAGRAPRPRPRPAQLPPGAVPFTGRRSELAALDRLRRDAPAVLVIAGTAGVGKTALATAWSHRIKEQFPDGQLHVNLRGYDPDRPIAADEALVGFFGALLPAGASVPAGLDERAARFRSELAERRVLVLLDNAATAEQIRPLLPGDPGCLVVVTSRDSLPGLVARDGARRLDLDLLDATDAAALLRRLVGDRAAADPAATAALAELCARLPLALRVAAERAVARPGLPLADLVGELADERRRLDLLAAGGDERTAVRCVFSWSVRDLPPPAARLFRLLGRQPGPDLGVPAAAALLGVEPDRAHDVLDVLARAHLVRMTGGGRYDMHDLLRAYARDLPADDAPAALDRLLDHYLATAARAMDQIYPAEKLRRPAPPAAPGPHFRDAADALGWLDAERACLLAAGVYAAASGRPDHARDLSATLLRYLDGRHNTDALVLHGAALQAARDPTSEALARNALGGACIQSGRYDEASGHLTRALDLFAAVGDLSGQARALANLGTVAERLGDLVPAAERLGDLVPAAERYERSLALFARVGDDAARAHVLTRLGAVQRRLGRPADAAGHLTEALALHRRTAHRFGEAWALSGLGEAELDAGAPERAAELLGQSLALFRELGDPAGEAWALTGLGAAEAAAGRPRSAAGHHDLAGRIFAEIGERDGQAWAFNGLGEAARAEGRLDAAIGHHEAALRVAVETGARDQQTRAHAGLAVAWQAAGDPQRAASHRRHASALRTS